MVTSGLISSRSLPRFIRPWIREYSTEFSMLWKHSQKAFGGSDLTRWRASDCLKQNLFCLVLLKVVYLFPVAWRNPLLEDLFPLFFKQIPVCYTMMLHE